MGKALRHEAAENRKAFIETVDPDLLFIIVEGPFIARSLKVKVRAEGSI